MLPLSAPDPELELNNLRDVCGPRDLNLIWMLVVRRKPNPMLLNFQQISDEIGYCVDWPEMDDPASYALSVVVHRPQHYICYSGCLWALDQRMGTWGGVTRHHVPCV